MAMVGVALVLYGLIKIVSWTFTRSGSKKYQEDIPDNNLHRDRCDNHELFIHFNLQ